MKKLSISLFALFFIGMNLTSCKKESQQETQSAPQSQTQAQSTPKLFERTLQVYDADKANSATLRFQASSKEALAQLPLDEFEFTLVKTPEDMEKAKDPAASSVTAAPSFSSDAGQRSTINPDDLRASDKAVSMDLQFDPKMKSASVEIKSKRFNANNRASGTPAEESLSAATATYSLYYHQNYWHRVQVKNNSYNPVYTAFYYHYGSYTYYSGYSYNLYKNGWSYYYNCSRSVGAYVKYSSGSWFTVTWWSNC